MIHHKVSIALSKLYYTQSMCKINLKQSYFFNGTLKVPSGHKGLNEKQKRRKCLWQTKSNWEFVLPVN